MTVKDENGLFINGKEFYLNSSGSLAGNSNNSALTFTNSTSGCFFDYYIDGAELGQAIPIITTNINGTVVLTHQQSGLYAN